MKGLGYANKAYSGPFFVDILKLNCLHNILIITETYNWTSINGGLTIWISW